MKTLPKKQKKLRLPQPLPVPQPEPDVDPQLALESRINKIVTALAVEWFRLLGWTAAISALWLLGITAKSTTKFVVICILMLISLLLMGAYIHWSLRAFLLGTKRRFTLLRVAIAIVIPVLAANLATWVAVFISRRYN